VFPREFQCLHFRSDLPVYRIGPAEPYFSFSGLSISAPLGYYERLPEYFMITRAAYEPLLRRLVRERCPNVDFLTGIVTGVTPAADRRKLESVTFRPDSSSANTEIQAADLVIGEHAGDDCFAR
jgi:hypothetical protein